MGAGWFSTIFYTLRPTDSVQEGWLAKHAVSEEDREVAEEGKLAEQTTEDPMQGLEGLDVAGPKLA